MNFLIHQDDALFNGRIKIYPLPDGEQIRQIMVCSKPIFNPHGFECAKSNKLDSKITEQARALWDTEDASAAQGDRWEQEAKDNLLRAQRRARGKVFDLAACNHFDLFVTLTLNADRIDRYDYRTIVRKLGQWLDNRVRRKDLKYVIVPELHKDGAVHFHGLFNDVLTKVSSGHKYRDGRTIYNLPEWTLGFTTAIELNGCYEAVCNYVCKYITKSDGCVGGRYYLSGGKLLKPRYEYFNADYENYEAPREFEVPQARISYKILDRVAPLGEI